MALLLLLLLLLFPFLPSVSARATTTYPKFEFRVRENSQVGTRVGSLLTYAGIDSGVTTAKLESSGPHIVQPYCERKFGVDQATGYVVVEDELDREAMCGALAQCPCYLRLILKDDSIVNVNILVLDENDHAPAFAVPVKAITISENAAVGYEHALDLALDPDRPPNDVKQYSLQVAHDAFGVQYNGESAELKLILKQKLDHETISQYNATLDACDGAPNRRCGSQKLIISVKDENDNPPVFDEERYVVDVPENTTMGTRVARLKATDADAGENGRVTYAMRASQKSVLSHWFHVDDTTGDVYLKSKLSFKTKTKYDILIDATDHGNSPRKKTVTLTINVKDLNDNAPDIKLKYLTGKQVQIKENQEMAAPVAHLIVTDNDDPNSPGGKFDCKLMKGHEYFKLDRIVQEPVDSIYALQPIRSFDRERVSVYVTHINCQDFGDPPLGARIEVPVNILDENEHIPTFHRRNFSHSVPENRHVGEFVLRVTATDDDADARLRYKLDRDGQQYFRIQETSGDIYTLAGLNREEVSVINFGVIVTDAESGIINTASASVRILVLDINDNAPKVIGKRRFSVEENTGETRLGQLQATDPDAGDNGRVVFRLKRIRNAKDELVSSRTFQLESDGTLSVLQSLDREVVSQYLIDIDVHDQGQPQHNTSSTIIVDVLDQNDNKPVWTHPLAQNTMMNITDLVKPGHVITRVHAKDDDVLQNVTYHLKDDAQGHFQVNPMSGKLRVSSLLKPGVYPLILVASDNGIPVRTSSMSYIINVCAHSAVSMTGNRSPMNFTLVVGMIAATCVISISLLIAIFVVRRRTLRTRRPKADLVNWPQEEAMYPANGSVYPLSSQTYYPGTPMTSFGQQEKTHSTIRALPTDMEVASADSGHGASEEENGQQAALGCGAGGGVGGDLKMVRGDYRPHIANSRACPILPEDSVIQCGCGDTIDLAGNTVHPRASSLSTGSHHSAGCAMAPSPLSASVAPPAYHLAASGVNGGSTFRTFPRLPRAPVPEGSGSIDGSLSRLCHSPQTNV